MATYPRHSYMTVEAVLVNRNTLPINKISNRNLVICRHSTLPECSIILLRARIMLERMSERNASGE